jgi:hypothetical protein
MTRSRLLASPPMMRRTGLCGAVVVLCLVAAAPAAAAWWTPPKALTWYWQLTGTPKVEPVMATDVDGFDTSAASVAQFHALGQRMICYIDVGTAENWRPDYGEFPAADLGKANGWPGELWLNVTDPAIRPIMAARFQMCRQKGFDAVEPDNMDGYENSTGFNITAAQQLAYDEWVANEVHSLGMAVFQKNDPDQASQLEPYFDGVIDEQCNQYSECGEYSSYLAAAKPVLNAEYTGGTSFCSADRAAGIMGALYSVNLDGSTYEPCFGPSPQGPPIGTSSGSTGAPTASAPTHIDLHAPRVRLGVGVLTVHRRRIPITVRCPRGQSVCSGTLTLATVARFRRGRRSAPLALGTVGFRLAGGAAKVVAVPFSAGARRRLGARHRVRVRIVARARDAAGRHAAVTAERTLQLRR